MPRALAPVLTAACLIALAGGCSTGGWASGNAGPASGGPDPMTLAAASAPAEAPPVEPAADDASMETLNVSRASFADEGADFDPCVSPDGSRLFFASTQHRRTSDLYVKLTDSRVVTQLTTDPADDAMPALSPDGTKLAFASNRNGQWDIFVMPATGGRAVRITDDAADEISPSWSPDGSSLVYSRVGTGSGRWEMWVAALANPGTPTFIGHGLFPKWCPVPGTGQNGADQIVFQQPRERGSRTFGVWTVDITEAGVSNATQIVASPDSACINPSWSPDGRWIVFAEIPAGGRAETRQFREVRAESGSLWMISTSGEGRVPLTSGRGLNLSPVWGPGERLFYVSDRTGRENIWAMEMGPAVASAMAATAGGGHFANDSRSGTSDSEGAQAGGAGRADNKPVATAREIEPNTPR
ncbi:MAG: hypothetical protein DYG92_11585 [Leptolyngbya sp. PLA1]|nr:hypothetical protein [Leptolyngbya sp. PLA1]